MYGLPGSGKTTLCRYLCDCLFTKFKGKAIHLELSMNAEDEELLIKFKELLTQLTNFNNKMDLSRVSSILQAYQLLNNTDVKNSQVFLIVDNVVSERSRRFVEELFVRLDVAAGSKILLVARSIDILRPFLQNNGMHQNTHYVYGSISVPCLTTWEAVQVLLRYKDDVGPKSSHAQEATLTSSHRQIMEEVVKGSGFRGECGDTIYLPLVLERMGVELREGKLDVESWSKTMKKLCKEDAVKRILEKGFRSLTKRCQTVFLDVVLFILSVRFLDYERRTVDAICSHLSIFHACEPERIELEMEELQRHGFLKMQREDQIVPIKVHDLYLEFAARTEEAASYYCNSGLWASKNRHHHQHMYAAGSTEPWLRTAVLELDGQCFEISSNFSSAKGISFRNCISLKTLGGFANLTCVMSLEIHNCPNLRWLESTADYKWPHIHIQMFQWTNRRSLYNLQLQTVEDSSFKTRRKKDNISLVPLHHVLFLMKGLVILRLENTGITQGLDMSCVPQLRALEVSERHMKYLRVCNLPNLERFVFLGDGTQLSNLSDMYNYGTCIYVSYKEKPVVMGKEFFAGCPRLQEMTVRSVAFKDEWQDSTLASSHLKYFRMECLHGNVTELPKLSTAAAESLQHLSLVNCQELRSLNFGCVYRNLVWLVLQDCENATEVSGLDKLPNLQTLVIRGCPKLKRVSSLWYLQSLQKFVVDRISRRLQRFFLPDFENMTQASGDSDSVASLVNGVIVGSIPRVSEPPVIESGRIVELRAGLPEPCTLKCELINLEKEGLTCHDLINLIRENGSNLVELAGQISKSLSQYSFKPFELRNAQVETLRLQKLVPLKSLKGIEHLSSITCLVLNKLPHLSRLQGIGSLKCLRHLFLWNCRALGRISSLYRLRRLEELSCRNCKKLKEVEELEILGWLQDVELYRCANLSRFPLDLKWWNRRVKRLDVRGSKFAGVETLVAWAEDKEVPEVLRRASLQALQ